MPILLLVHGACVHLAGHGRGAVLGAWKLCEGGAQVFLLVAVAHLRCSAAESIQRISLWTNIAKLVLLMVDPCVP